jgi:hypothetical protein
MQLSATVPGFGFKIAAADFFDRHGVAPSSMCYARFLPAF